MNSSRVWTVAAIILAAVCFLLSGYSMEPTAAQVIGAETEAANVPLAEENGAAFHVSPDED